MIEPQRHLQKTRTRIRIQRIRRIGRIRRIRRIRRKNTKTKNIPTYTSLQMKARNSLDIQGDEAHEGETQDV